MNNPINQSGEDMKRFLSAFGILVIIFLVVIFLIAK